METPITDAVREREGSYLEWLEALELSHNELVKFVESLDHWHHLLPESIQFQKARVLKEARKVYE